MANHCQLHCIGMSVHGAHVAGGISHFGEEELVDA